MRLCHSSKINLRQCHQGVRSAWLPNLAGELLARAAVQAANAIQSRHVSPNERQQSAMDFNVASAAATKFFSGSLALQPTPDKVAAVTRALQIIEHLKAQVAANDDASDQPDA